MWPNAGRSGGGRPGRSLMAALGIVAALLVIRMWVSVSSVDTRRATLITVAVMVVVFLLVAVLGLKFFDLSGRREERAARVQNRITERLRDAMTGLPITVVAAYASPSPRSPLVVEVAGQVPTAAIRERVLQLARQEATRLGRHIRVADRLEVQSVADRRAA
jgi:heme/copper-type cytochrome/quinol oxidase subunit 2